MTSAKKVGVTQNKLPDKKQDFRCTLATRNCISRNALNDTVHLMMITLINRFAFFGIKGKFCKSVNRFQPRLKEKKENETLSTADSVS